MTEPQLDPDQPGFGAPEGQPEGTAPDSVQMDYFGFSSTDNFYLPDRKSYMVCQKMNEGAKASFQKKTQRDVVLTRGSGDAKFRVDPAVERHELIKTCVIDWNMTRNGQPVNLSTNASGNKKNLEDFLELADPAIVEDLESFIRKMNPWLAGDMTVKDIDDQINQLQEQRKELVEREAGEGFSSSR